MPFNLEELLREVLGLSLPSRMPDQGIVAVKGPVKAPRKPVAVSKGPIKGKGVSK
jgi:hypothetical protein